MHAGQRNAVGVIYRQPNRQGTLRYGESRLAVVLTGGLIEKFLSCYIADMHQVQVDKRLAPAATLTF